MSDFIFALQNPPYIPEEWVCIAFLVVFGLISAFHVFQATFYQTWWFSLAVLFTGTLEIAGWALRLKFSLSQSDIFAFHSQYSILFVAPLPLFVAVWGMFLKIVPRLGRHFTRPFHSLYVQLIWIMYTGTIVLEAIGVGELSNATRIGGRVLFAGSYLYLALLIASNVLAVDVITRYDATKVLDAMEEVYARKRNNKQLMGLWITEGLLLISAIYRAVDISLLNRDMPMKQEWPSDIFSGLPVLLSMLVLSIFHPGRFHKDGPLSHEFNSSPQSSPRMSHKQLPRINTNIVWKPRPQPGQQQQQMQQSQQPDEKAAPPPSRVVYAGNHTKTTPPTL